MADQEAPIQKKGIFGITQETKTTNNSPLLVPTKLETPNPRFPSGYKFPLARLVNVVANPALEKKDGTTVPVLQFIFKDKDGRQYTHTEWEVEANDSSFDKKLEGLQVRIAHIYTVVFGKMKQGGIGTEATSFGEFFTMTAAAFNSEIKTITVKEGEEPKSIKVYSTVDLYYKLIYYKSRLGFPLSPNFLERAIEGQPCKTLSINTTYDKLEASVTNTPGGGMGAMMGGAGAGTSDLPAFDGTFS